MAQQSFTPLSNTEVSAFCSQMAMILGSGISSLEGITLMLEETKHPEEKALLSSINETLMATGSFHEALEETKAFPSYMLHMVQIGEFTGRLDDVMKALSAHYDREASIAQSIKNAVTYPLIMVCMMLLVILVLITRVMPIFNQVFKQLGSEMTGLSRAILNFGTAIDRYAIVLIVIIAVLVLLVLYFAKTKSGRAKFRSFSAHFAWTKSYSEKIAACRFASGMSLTLSSGMSPDECLDYAEKLIDNAPFRSKIDACKKEISEGEELSRALLKTDIFSGIYARMVSIGSKTGVLDEVMHDIADKYQEEVDQKFSNIIATLEPTLVIVLSLIVGLILLSVMLPLVGIMSSL